MRVLDIKIREATEADIPHIVRFVDTHFTREGYGFVTSGQMKTEVRRGAVYLALDGNIIVGSRMGLERIYNLAVHKNYRGQGIGRKLVEIYHPNLIRVKADPVGNLSKTQKENFENPEGFYQSLGYELQGTDYAKNFYQRGRTGEKAHFHKRGKKHIKIYQKPIRELPLFKDLTDDEVF